MVTWKFPSSPENEIHMPSRIGYGSRIKVRSASYKVHVEPQENGEDRVYQTMDPAAMEHELVIQTLLDPRTFHNLTQLNAMGQEVPIRIDRTWIETMLDEEDGLELGGFLMSNFGDELGLDSNDDSDEAKKEEVPESEPITKEKPASKRGHEATTPE
jgi:hypothetical protein